MVIIKSELVIDDGDSVEVPVTFPEELSAAGTGHSTVSEEPLSFVSGRNAQRPIDVKHVSRRLAKMRERLSNSHGFQAGQIDRESLLENPSRFQSISLETSGPPSLSGAGAPVSSPEPQLSEDG
eukprot:299184-Rhodomonas_salina.1